MNPNYQQNPLPYLRPFDRWPYFCWGAGLMALKYNMDRAVAFFGFHRTWYFWNYLKPHGFGGIAAIPPDNRAYYLILLLTSLPFLAAGIYLTLRRLRSAGLPLALCLLFFVPVLNLVFFVLLCLVPSRQPKIPLPQKIGWETHLPTSAAGSALLSILVVGTLGVGLTFFSTDVMQNYGWGLFVGEPFAMGLVSVLIYGWTSPRSFASSMGVAALTIAFVGLSLLLLAIEGFICLIMAAPIGMVLALAGGLVGVVINDLHHTSIRPGMALLILLAVPFTTGMEASSDEKPALLCVRSSVVIDAPPEKVWPNVIAFSAIDEPRDWILRTGVAYPNRARIDGLGVGAIRHCIFTTGEFVEPIKAWDENHLLRFSVAAQPEPMEEMSPYPRLKTPHLHGYLESQEGELRLTALPGGRTLLAGTTWYTDKIWPSGYWQLWSDMVIHHIHLRVLNHIKTLAEMAN